MSESQSTVRDESSSLWHLEPTEFPQSILQTLGETMGRAREPGSTDLPSGYVYLGQLIAHDVSRLAHVPCGPGMQQVPAPQHTAALDLNGVYGSGMDDPRIALDPNTSKMLLGDAMDGVDRIAGLDLPRNADHTPRIADERNDENLLVAQLHLQFLKLHNFFVDAIDADMPGLGRSELFQQARQELILHYQHVVLYDFLDSVLDSRVWEHCIANGAHTDPLWNPANTQQQTVPIEFAAAAFRFGHSMVRCDYALNESLSVNFETLFNMTGRGRFGGASGLPKSHVVDWRLFFRDARSAPRHSLRTLPLNLAQCIDPVVRVQLPPNSSQGQREFLSAKNLFTGNRSQLPDAQTLVRHIQAVHPQLTNMLGIRCLQVHELNPQIGITDAAGDIRMTRLLDEVGGSHNLHTSTPLWYYLLAEAKAVHGGHRLGPLSSLIIADVILGLIRRSSPSLLDPDSTFEFRYIEPTKELHGRRFMRMADLLAAVG